MSEDTRKGSTFDKTVAKAYTNKVKNAAERGLEFDLSFTTFKNLYRAKKCQLTGLPLTLERSLCGERQLPNTLTIDRIDSKKGYIEGNVMAVSHAANSFKAVCEQGGVFGYGEAIKLGKALAKLKKSGKIST